ncbi:MAG: hypothetical protein IKE20_03610, partial [Eggerthellaceae bacterium]|nr:hypothetical protein [Eggerthellaceae bacterium]
MSMETHKQEGVSAMHHMSESLSGKKLLLLAGADPHRKVVEAAHELGVYVVVADYLPIEDAPAKQIADEAWQVDVFDVDGLVERIQDVGIDGVLNFCLDAPQKPYQQICERLGFPCYGTQDQFEVLSNKNSFKQYCSRHGLLTIPSYSEEEALSGKAPLPLFVKPSDGRGSRGQTICYTQDELQPAIEFAKEVSRNKAVTIEKYFDGAQDFSISCMVIDSVPHIIKMGDRYDGSKLDGMDRQHICTLSPTVQREAFLEKTKPRIEKFIADLGIRFGALFLQGFIEDGEVYCYDPGLRLPGSDFDLITRDITGFDPMKSAVNFALTGDEKSCYGDPRDACMLNGGLGVILSLAVRPGVIAKFEGAETVGGDPRVHGVSIRHKVGDMVEKTGDTNQRLVEFVAYLKSRDELPALF